MNTNHQNIRDMIHKVFEGKFIEAQEKSSSIFADMALEKMNSLKIEVAQEFFNKNNSGV